jgi:hypothetical protein
MQQDKKVRKVERMKAPAFDRGFGFPKKMGRT